MYLGDSEKSKVSAYYCFPKYSHVNKFDKTRYNDSVMRDSVEAIYSFIPKEKTQLRKD